MTVPTAPRPARPVDDAIIETGWGQWAHDWAAYGLDRPRVKAQRTAVQAVPTNAVTAIAFQTTVFQKGAMWVVGAATRLTVADAGLYLTGGWVRFATSPTGMRQAQIRRNGTLAVTVDARPAVNLATDIALSSAVELNAGDYLELTVYHERTVSCDVLPAELYAIWEGPLTSVAGTQAAAPAEELELEEQE